MFLFRSFIYVSLCFLLSVATDDGLTRSVTWDNYGLIIDGSYQWILSGEFHYQRLPVPELWPDIFQKLKANGFNTVSIYFFWSYHSPEKDIFDFQTSGKNVQLLLDYAKQAGLYVIARPGPYFNAETNGAGYALWGSDGRIGTIRSNDVAYYNAWAPFVERIATIISKNQISEGGPIILVQVENEFSETVHKADNPAVLYMEQLESAFRDAGIVVPLTHNEKGMRAQSWSTDYENVGGAVNIYGLDSYPGGLSCTNNNTGFKVSRNYYQWFQNYSFTQPEYLAEFEGGWFSGWGGDTFYDECFTEHSPEFADVFYKNNIGQRVTLLNIYMTYGGTNWGHSAAPVVYSSYDYSAPLRETRQIWNKMYQIKMIGLFTRVSNGLIKTEMVGNGTGYSVSTDSVFSWVLRSLDGGGTYHILQQTNTASTDSVQFSAMLNSTNGVIEVPVSLDGRQSKILVTDYPFGSKTLLYTSADILTYGVFDVEVLVFYLAEGQDGEFSFVDSSNLSFEVFGFSNVSQSTTESVIRYKWTQAPGVTTIKFSNGVLVYLLEQETAWHFWAPATTSAPDVKPDKQIFVIGPYLVRSANIVDRVLHISGDNDVKTTLEAYTGTDVQFVVWNGQRLSAKQTRYGSITVQIPGAEDRIISLPLLENWRSANSAPEVQASYDDSRWVICDKNHTLNPYQPLTLPVLYSSDYGYYVGPKIYRGYFDGRTPTSVNITVSGGLGFGWNAWLNGALIGGDSGKDLLTTTTTLLEFPQSLLKDVDNVLTVIVDYHGHDEASTGKGVLNPRGILGAILYPDGTRLNTGFKIWKIRGNAGASANIDPVRGPMNEGGLYAERLGWHLPDFDTNGWARNSPLDGIAKSGIEFYATTFQLNIDSDIDAPLGIELSSPNGTIARVMFWVNGYQYGKYIPHIGPQTRFPVPPGIINNRGKNTIALSLWAHTDDGANLDEVKLINYGQYQTNFRFDQDWSYLQPPWTDSRGEYA